MQADLTRLQSVFDFAELNLDGLDAKGTTRAKSDVMKFLGPELGEAIPRGWWLRAFAPRVKWDELAPLQDEVRKLLDALISGHHQNPPRVSLMLGVFPLGAGLVQLTAVQGAIQDRYLLALAMLIGQVGAERVRACPACGRAYLKVGRRAYCRRPECETKRAGEYWQQYKVGPKGKRTIRAARKRQYAAKGWRLGARPKRRPKGR